MEMMKEMQGNIMSQTLTFLENRGTKPKVRKLDENLGILKSHAEFSDISD